MTLSLVPGQGLGLNPGCTDDERLLQTLNRVPSTSHNNIGLTMGDCYRLEPVFEQLTSSPPTYSIEPGKLKVYGDCEPCCLCSQYEAVYEAIVKLDETYKSLGRKSEKVRDLYAHNRDRSG